jgi:hypothetical protein
MNNKFKGFGSKTLVDRWPEDVLARARKHLIPVQKARTPGAKKSLWDQTFIFDIHSSAAN